MADASDANWWKPGVWLLVFVALIYLLAHIVPYPHVAMDETVGIAKGTSFQFAYTPNRTNRKLTANVESLNGVPLQLFILPSDIAKLAIDGKLTLAEVVANTDGAYSPAVIKGAESRYITSGKEWSVIVSSRNADATVHLKVTTILRF